MTNVGNLQVNVTLNAQQAQALFAQMGQQAQQWGQTTARAGATAAAGLNQAAAAATATAGATAGLNRAQRNQMGLTSNLSAQYFDLATTIQMMQNPMTIAIQQGSQIAQVFNAAAEASGRRGFAGALDVVGGALRQLLNPMTLGVVLLTGLAAAAAQYFIGLFDETKKAKAALEAHEQLIKDIAAAWPGAEKAFETYTGKIPGLLLAAANKGVRVAQDALEAGLSEALPGKDLPMLIRSGEEFAGFVEQWAKGGEDAEMAFAGIHARLAGMLGEANRLKGSLEQPFATAALMARVHIGESLVRELAAIDKAFHTTSDEVNDLSRKIVTDLLLADGANFDSLIAQFEELQRAALVEGDDTLFAEMTTLGGALGTIKELVAGLKNAKAGAQEVRDQVVRTGPAAREVAAAWAAFFAKRRDIDATTEALAKLDTEADGTARTAEMLFRTFTQRDDLKTDDIIAVAVATEKVKREWADLHAEMQGPLLPEGFMNAEQILTEHQRVVGEVAKTWDVPKESINELGRTMKAVLVDDAQDSANRMETIFEQSAVRLADSFKGALAGDALQGAQFAPVRAALDAFIASVERGEPDVVALAQALLLIKQNDPSPELEHQADAALEATKETLALKDASVDGAAAAIGAAGGYDEMARAADRLAAAARRAAMAARDSAAAGDALKALETQGVEINPREEAAANLKKVLAEADAIGSEALRARGLEAYEGRLERIAVAEAKAAAAAAKHKTEIEKLTEAHQKWVQSLIDQANPMLALQRDFQMLEMIYQNGEISLIQYILALDALKKKQAELNGETAKAFNLTETYNKMMEQWGQQVASSLADAIVEGKDLEEVFKDLIKQLAKMALQMLVLQPIMNALLGGMGGGSGGGSWLPPDWFGRSAGSVRGINPTAGGGRNAMTTGGSSVSNSMGGMTINFGADGGSSARGGNDRGTAFAKRVRDLIQREMVSQSRPGGLLYSTR
jgi:hypothetical protein